MEFDETSWDLMRFTEVEWVKPGTKKKKKKLVVDPPLLDDIWESCDLGAF